ncbi:Ni/Fe-hydrogenase cytochrome b subunit [Desulfothermus okinawensis JCM 13304]
MDNSMTVKQKFFTPRTYILLILGIIGIITMLYRLAVGLGPSTNLSDTHPWGLWIAFDVTTGVALAAGGFTVTFAAYIANWDKYKPIARAATLTAFLGYLLVLVGLLMDIGKPFAFWHPFFLWNPHSVMFEIVICISTYTTVLTLEFLPWLLERLNVLTGLKDFLEQKAVVFCLVILGIMLSYGHQSSLGGLFLIDPHKLHPLWYSHIMHHLFFLSAICAGISMVSIETIISANLRNREYEFEVLQGLARGASIALLVYFVVRFLDIGIHGKLHFIFQGTGASLLFLIEMVLCVLVPMIFLSSKTIQGSVPSLLLFHSLVIFGVILNRFDVVFLTEANMGKGFYFPSWQEIAITLGLISIGLFLYKLIVTYLPIFDSPSDQAA